MEVADAIAIHGNRLSWRAIDFAVIEYIVIHT